MPHHGHEPCTIAEGDPHHTIGGVPVAYDGQKTTYGTRLQTTIKNYPKS